MKSGIIFLKNLLKYHGGGQDNPLLYSCLENPRGQRSLAGYGPWGCKESDTTERQHTQIQENCITNKVRKRTPLERVTEIHTLYMKFKIQKHSQRQTQDGRELTVKLLNIAELSCSCHCVVEIWKSEVEVNSLINEYCGLVNN